MADKHHHHHHHHWGERGDYAHRAGRPGPGPNFHRLRRDTRRGKIAGVCAGLSNYFGWRLKWVRILTIVSMFVFVPLAAIAYVAAAILMKADNDQVEYRDEETERFWRTFSIRPKVTFSELRHRFRALDARVSEIEDAVTSDEYGLRKEFRDLERGA